MYTKDTKSLCGSAICLRPQEATGRTFYYKIWKITIVACKHSHITQTPNTPKRALSLIKNETREKLSLPSLMFVYCVLAPLTLLLTFKACIYNGLDINFNANKKCTQKFNKPLVANYHMLLVCANYHMFVSLCQQTICCQLPHVVSLC